ncbi:hypothetical protein [Aeromicrobium sp. UC242_57]|uniref:hypothetical protein n=1 Tax=Aeromicrobium sp. UC242_57 TaxID=3374624 RepID=UPI0037C162BA
MATTPRLNLLDADLPAELTRTVRVLQRERIKPESIRLDELAQEPSAEVVAADVVETPIPEDFTPSWLDKLKGLVGRIVGRDTIDDAALQAIADKFEQQEAVAVASAKNAENLQAERERLEDQVGDLRRQLEAEQLERALAEDSRRAAEKKTRSLERWRAERADQFTYVDEAVMPWETDPLSVAEIVERLTDEANFGDILQYVELTDVEKAIDRADQIDAADPSGTYASSFWEYVLVLRDYMIECVEHGFSGNLTCTSTPRRCAGESVRLSATRLARATPCRTTRGCDASGPSPCPWRSSRRARSSWRPTSPRPTAIRTRRACTTPPTSPRPRRRTSATSACI